jgi:hypothetical protein
MSLPTTVAPNGERSQRWSQRWSLRQPEGGFAFVSTPRERAVLPAFRWAIRSLRKGQSAAVGDVVSLVKARSMLIVLQATCRETLSAFEATGNALDAQFAADLRSIVTRTEDELAALSEQIESER